MKLLGRDDFLSVNHLKRELVEVPALEGSVYLRELSTAKLLIFNQRIEEFKQGDENRKIDFETSLELMALVIALSAEDEAGQPIFTVEDVKQIANNKIDMLVDLSTKALEISGLSMDKVHGLTSEVATNLKNIHQTSSPSNLPENSKRRKRK